MLSVATPNVVELIGLLCAFEMGAGQVSGGGFADVWTKGHSARG
jgi:hypothetical protein